MLMVDFLTAVNAVLPFNPVGHQGTPQLFHSPALLPHISSLQQLFQAPGNPTLRSTLRHLRQRIRQQTSQLTWNAPLRGSIRGCNSAFHYDGPTLTWKQFWRAVECLMEGREDLLVRVEYDEEDQHLELMTTADIPPMRVREYTRTERLAGLTRLFGTPPWNMSEADLRQFCMLTGLRDENLDLTNPLDRDLATHHGFWYLNRHHIKLQAGERITLDGEDLHLPEQLSLRELLGLLIMERVDLDSGRADGLTVKFSRLPEREGSEDSVEESDSDEESPPLPDPYQMTPNSRQSSDDSSTSCELVDEVRSMANSEPESDLAVQPGDLSLREWVGPPPLRDDVIATGREAESLLPFFNRQYQPGKGNALRPPNEVPQAEKEEVMRYLDGAATLQAVGEEIARRLRKFIRLESQAVLVVQRGSVLRRENITPNTTYLELLVALFRDQQPSTGHVLSFEGDELRFRLA
jgi:hypothetical protein